MTKDERNLLLYIETRAVDYGGSLDNRHLNEGDMKILERWKEEGFIDFGRIAFKTTPEFCKTFTLWATLTEEAWKEAWTERIARFTRVYENRRWMTTEEYRNS